MKKHHLLIITVLLGLMIVLSACMPGPRVTGSPGLAVSDAYVFVAYRNFVYRLDITNGSVDWEFPEKASNQILFYAQPLVTDDYIYVGDLANNFYKIDIETGKAEWTFSEAEGFYIGQAAESDGIVYAPSNDGNLYAIDENGALLWYFETGHYIWAQPLVVDDAIFVGSMDHKIYCITKDGEEIWSVKLEGAITGSPVLSKDQTTLYVGSIGNDMLALDADTGEQQWSYIAEDSIWGGPALTDELLYVADAGGNFYGLDLLTGNPEIQTEFEGSAVGDLVALTDGIVLATEQGLIEYFKFDGTTKWESTLSGEIFQAPVLNDDYLIAGTINGDNLIYAFNLAGVQKWSTTPED